MSTNFKLNRSSYDYTRSERVDWIDEFANQIEKASVTAVEVSRYRNQTSIHEQINSIINNGPITANKTVEGIVHEMQERVGLKTYLAAVVAKRETNKVAQTEEAFAGLNPALKESILSFIKNKTKTNYGHGVTFSSIQHDLISLFDVSPEDINNEEVSRFIENLIAEERKLNPSSDDHNHNLGKGVGVMDADDHENEDFFKGLMPVTD